MRYLLGCIAAVSATTLFACEQDEPEGPPAEESAPGGPMPPPGSEPPPPGPPPNGREPPLPPFVETFEEIRDPLVAAKDEKMARQRQWLEHRYDLSDRPAADARMSAGKPLQEGVRVRLPEGVNWEDLARMTPAQIREAGVFPPGFLPLPHVDHPQGGMVFPQSTIDEVREQTGRDLARFDIEFDLPEHLMPEFPPPMFLTTRPDAGDVTQGELLTTDNFWALLEDELNPKQLDGMRLLLTAFPQQQFNMTEDRRSERPSLGVACFDCHVNGSTNAAFHLVGDIRPQERRRRIDSPALRGLHVQQLFGSQRALHSVEDFTEFEQRAAYFDGDEAAAARKGMNPPDRGTEVHHMAEMQKIIDFPPAPKLDLYGRLDPALASEAELRGEALFHGKARCGDCHMAPFYTDNLAHDLGVERFYEPQMINGMLAGDQGRTKTFVLRGIKDTPPYLHDGRLLTLEDVVEFFNLVLQTSLDSNEKRDLVAFLRVL